MSSRQSAVTSELHDARAQTMRYHQQYYNNHELFQKGSWLEKPDQAVSKIIDTVCDASSKIVLDLGSGVGRNAIPLAKAGFTVICVDNLGVAVELLKRYAADHDVADRVFSQVCELDAFQVPENMFDILLAVSVLEHASSKEQVRRIIKQLSRGARYGGIALVTISTDRKVVEVDTDKPVRTLVETRLSANEATELLKESFSTWSSLDLRCEVYQERLQYLGKHVDWSSTEVRMLASMNDSQTRSASD
jgi:2-polyprenyl-3-methyl-5-hydroxy-6-metoxy-1,4-benzoquinol methylase